MDPPIHLPTFIKAWQGASGEIFEEWDQSPEDFVRARLEQVRPTFDGLMMRLAHLIATRSIDPSTKHGAVIVDDQSRILSMGYNGAVQGLDHSKIVWTRPEKYDYMIHAEANAILFAKQDLKGSTIYVTGPCCADCFNLVAQAGIKRCVFGPRVARCVTANSQKVQKEIAAAKGIEIVTYKKFSLMDSSSSTTDQAPPSEPSEIKTDDSSEIKTPGSSEVTKMDEPSQTKMDEPSQTKMDEPSQTKMDEPSQTKMDEPKAIDDEPKAIIQSTSDGSHAEPAIVESGGSSQGTLDPPKMTEVVIEDVLVSQVAGSFPSPSFSVSPSAKFDWQAWLNSLDAPDGEEGWKDGIYTSFVARYGETHGVHFSVVDGKPLAFSMDAMVGYWSAIGPKVKGFTTYDGHGMGLFGCKPSLPDLLKAAYDASVALKSEADGEVPIVVAAWDRVDEETSLGSPDVFVEGPKDGGFLLKVRKKGDYVDKLV